MSDRLGNEEHSVIAFYGLDIGNATLRQFYDQAMNWMRRFGYEPMFMGTGSAKGIASFRSRSRRAEKEGFSLEVTKHIHLYTAPHYSPYANEGTDIDTAISPKKNHCHVNFRSEVLRLGDPRFLQIAVEIAAMHRPAYGVGYRRLNDDGPSHFAFGLGLHVLGKPRDRVDSDLTINFRETTWQKLYLQGYLGGVFPWNFLTAPQLSKKIGNQTLEEWIRAAPGRGSLSPLTDAMTLWSVPDEDQPAIYKQLWDAEVVFDYLRHMTRLWQQKRRNEQEPATDQEVLGQVLHTMGYESPDQAQVLQVEGGGKLRELSHQEVEEAMDEGCNSNRKPPAK